MDGLSIEQRQAYDAVLRGESIFLTGPGGTGKSHLIGLLAERLPAVGKTLAITALTGCAAVLLGHGAKTFHSWAGIGLGKDPVDKLIASIKKFAPLKKRWRKTEVLIIDEISMMTPELLELINQIAKVIRNNTKPMGGIQMIFVGDFLQLPPVAKGGVVKFAFESPVWYEIVKRTIQLKRIFRQNDPIFQTILDEARNGEVSSQSLSILKSRRDLKWENEPIQPTLLFSRNMDVDSINNAKLAELKGEPRIYSVKTISTGEQTPTDLQRITEKMDKDATYVQELTLKVGAQVMLITNLDQEKGLVNGSRGVVTGFKELVNWPIVQFKNNHITIEEHVWKSEHEKPVERSQIPLRLAYALTIHKAQGATLDCALIDIGANTFEYGQAYVALSRMKSLESLYIHEVTTGAFRAHPLVKKFYAGEYIAPDPPIAVVAVESSIPSIPTVKRITPISGKKAKYGFDDERPAPQQASLKDYFGVPVKPVAEPVAEPTKRGLYGLDPSKYPARMGKLWNDEEIIKMLMAVRKKKTAKEIADIHERTPGSITSKLRSLAVDYYNNDKKPIAEIEKITGLSSTVIQEAIAKKNNTEA